SNLPEIAPRVLRAIAEPFQWSVGTLWTVDTKDDRIRCVETWGAAGEFPDRCREFAFRRGEGLPGTVWAAGKAVWLPELGVEEKCPRRPIARANGLYSGVAFPLPRGGEIAGVVEFFGRETRQPEPDLIRMMELIGGQIGEFLERKQLEDQLHHLQRLEGLGM